MARTPPRRSELTSDSIAALGSGTYIRIKRPTIASNGSPPGKPIDVGFDEADVLKPGLDDAVLRFRNCARILIDANNLSRWPDQTSCQHRDVAEAGTYIENTLA
jgi:hypothetical protein